MAEDEILVASAERRVPLFLERFGCLRPERHDATGRPSTSAPRNRRA
jgi:hypothetical protein